MMNIPNEIGEAASNGAPALSVVLITPGNYAGIRATLRHLAAQTIADRLELVLVGVDPDSVRIPEDVCAAFHRVERLRVPDIRSLSRAKAAAVRASTAPIVAFAEDHSFPEPEWAAALLEAHARGYSVVAPQMKNANSDSLLSWVAMFLHFAGNIEPDKGFETNYPGASHNVSYRRDALLELGDSLGRRMLYEGFLHEALRARGHRLWVEPSAATRHINMSYLRPLIHHAWVGGRLYGGLRQEFAEWSVLRRLVYACGSPLIPFLRMRRVMREIHRAGYGSRMLPRALPPMFAVLTAYAAGEAAGYLWKGASAEEEYSRMEIGRERFVNPDDLTLWD